MGNMSSPGRSRRSAKGRANTTPRSGTHTTRNRSCARPNEWCTLTSEEDRNCEIRPTISKRIVEMDVVPIILMRVLLSARRIERNMVNQQAN